MAKQGESLNENLKSDANLAQKKKKPLVIERDQITMNVDRRNATDGDEPTPQTNDTKNQQIPSLKVTKVPLK